MLAGRLRAHGSRPALEAEGRVLSYADLVERAEASPVPAFVRRKNGSEWLVEALACWLSQSCLMPLAADWEPLPPPSLHCPPGDFLALVSRSSGSTGQPKLTPHPLSRLLRLADDLIELLELGPEDRSLWCVSGASAFILTSQILPCLLAGGCLVAQDGFCPDLVSGSLLHQGITRTYLFPAQYRALLSYPGQGHRLRACVTGGELCPPSLHQAFENHYGIGIHQSMGMSETLAYCLNTSERQEKKGSAGQPIGECRVRIQDGQIEVYRPDLGWYATGDAGMLDEDGYLWFLGRLGLCGEDPVRWRRQLDQLSAWPEVAEVALIGQTAFLVVLEQHRPEVRERLSALELNAYFLEEMPRSPAGKTHYPALARLLAE